MGIVREGGKSRGRKRNCSSDGVGGKRDVPALNKTIILWEELLAKVFPGEASSRLLFYRAHKDPQNCSGGISPPIFPDMRKARLEEQERGKNENEEVSHKR